MKNKYTGQEEELPFDVSYSSEKSPSGVIKKYYSIKGLKAFDYYKDDIQALEDKMDANGWNSEQKTQFFLTSYPQVFELRKGKLEVKDENFKTLLVQDIINYADKLRQ